MSVAGFVVLDALVDCYTAAVPPFTGSLPGNVKVIDGEPIDPPPKFLCVGWGGPGDPAESGQLAIAGARRMDEDSEIQCLLSYWDGSRAAQLRQVRAAAAALFGTFDAALAADRTLGRTAMGARASAYEYVPDLNREGALVELRWTVSFRALTV